MAKEDNKKSPKKVTPSKCPPQSSPRPEDQHAPSPIGSKATPKDAPKQESKHEKTVRTRLQRRQDQITASTTSPQILTAESNPSKTFIPPITSKETQIIASDTRIETPETSSSQIPVATEIATQAKAQKTVESLSKKVQPPPVQPKPLHPKAAQRIEIGKTQSAIERIE